MSGTPPFTRKPYEPSGYASLRADAAEPAASPGAEQKPAASTEFDIEAARLKAMREALWMAFDAGPDAGLPTTLIDLSMAYTGSLKLQLAMRGFAYRHGTAKPRASPTPRPHGGKG